MKLTDYLVRNLIGKTAKADHPITCLNPTETFVIVDARVDPHRGTISVKGENTCWFGQNMTEIVEQ